MKKKKSLEMSEISSDWIYKDMSQNQEHISHDSKNKLQFIEQCWINYIVSWLCIWHSEYVGYVVFCNYIST